MDEEHCVIAVPNGICEIHEPQIKRRHNVFLICPAVPARWVPSLSMGTPAEWKTTVQKYALFPTWQKKIVGHSGDGGGGALPARGITALPPMAVGPSPDHPRTTLGPSPDQELLMR